MRLSRRHLTVALITIGILDFAAFAMVGGMLGGAAIHGKSEGSHFYLGGHRGYIEVSQATFNYSRIHGYTVLVTAPVAVLSGVLLLVDQRRRSSQRSR